MASSQMIEMSWWGSLEVKYFFLGRGHTFYVSSVVFEFQSGAADGVSFCLQGLHDRREGLGAVCSLALGFRGEREWEGLPCH